MNASAKLLKYRNLLISLVYIVAIVLVLQLKWEYFETHWEEDEVERGRATIEKYQEKNYKWKATKALGKQLDQIPIVQVFGPFSFYFTYILY